MPVLPVPELLMPNALAAAGIEQTRVIDEEGAGVLKPEFAPPQPLKPELPVPMLLKPEFITGWSTGLPKPVFRFRVEAASGRPKAGPAGVARVPALPVSAKSSSSSPVLWWHPSCRQFMFSNPELPNPKLLLPAFPKTEVAAARSRSRW